MWLQGQRLKRSGHKPKIGDSHQKLDEERNGFAPQPLGAELPSQPLDLSIVKVISDFWPLEWEEN